MIYVTGDLHGDIKRFKAAKKAKIKKNDVLAVCGDFGFIWEGTKKEKKLIKWIGKRKYKVMFVEGVNENHKLISEYPVCDIFSGKARRLSGNLYCMLRGEIYNIDGIKLFAFGGGDCGETFSQAVPDSVLLPSGEEMENASRNLSNAFDEVDLIVTHDVPTRLRAFIDPDSNKLTHLNAFLEDICCTVKFKQWYFGKYHQNRRIPPCYNMLFTGIVKFNPDGEAPASKNKH